MSTRTFSFGGTPLEVREVRPSDAGLVARHLAALPPSMRSRRFAGAPTIEDVIRILVEFGPPHRRWLIAFAEGRIVADILCTRHDDWLVGEVRCSVVADWRQRGLAPELLVEIALWAREHGITHLRALPLSAEENGYGAVWTRVHPGLRRSTDMDEIEVETVVDGWFAGVLQLVLERRAAIWGLDWTKRYGRLIGVRPAPRRRTASSTRAETG